MYLRLTELRHAIYLLHSSRHPIRHILIIRPAFRPSRPFLVRSIPKPPLKSPMAKLTAQATTSLNMIIQDSVLTLHQFDIYIGAIPPIRVTFAIAIIVQSQPGPVRPKIPHYQPSVRVSILRLLNIVLTIWTTSSKLRGGGGATHSRDFVVQQPVQRR